MSTAGSPSSETDPSDAMDVDVTRDCMSRRITMTTSTRSPAKTTSVTEPTSTPDTRTGAPGFNPAADGKIVFSEYRCQKNPPSPLRRKIRVVATTIAATVRRPILSSDQASERVRGI